MGAWALLLPLLVATAQAQVCSVSNTYFEVSENTNQSEPLADIYVPEGQQVTLGPSSTPLAFRIQGTQLFLDVTPDYEKHTMLQAQLECRRGDTVVTLLRVFVFVLDINDNAPVFPFVTKLENVSEDTKVNTIVVPETKLEAHDPDKSDILFYTLQEVTPGASNFFSLVGTNLPALRLDRSLDFYRCQNMTFQLLVRDTQEQNVAPSHTATATVILEVQPADLRPPWFLPCAYSDSHVCIQAEYHGAVPTGHTLQGPLTLRPGPIYAVDGDWGINQSILYSIVSERDDGTFAIDAYSGNLTMTGAVRSPKTFTLLVKGEQADHARYSVTRVTIEARNANGSLLQFPESRYRGTVALGSGAGVPVRDTASPSQPLRIWARDPEFPDSDSATTYRITNNTNFRMDGETVVTAALLADEGVFYAEVEATNTVTASGATTVVEIQVLEEEAPTPTGPPGPPEPPTSPEAGGTSSRATTAEAPRPPEALSGVLHDPFWVEHRPAPSLGHKSEATCLIYAWEAPQCGNRHLPPTSLTQRGLNTDAEARNLSADVPWAQRGPPALRLARQDLADRRPQGSPLWSGQRWVRGPQQGTPEPGGGSTAGDSKPGVSHTEDQRFSTVEMAALGGVLGALLVLTLIALLILVHKHYGHRFKCCSGKAQEHQHPQLSGFDNQAFHAPQESNWAPAPSPSPAPTPAVAPEPAPPEPPSLQSLDPASESPEVARDGGGPAAVRSILTKERRPEGGYKAVWFGEDIGAEADVVVLNTPASDAAGAADSGSEDSSDEAEAEAEAEGPGGGSRDDASSTYV